MLIDSHAHIDHPRFDKDRDELLQECQQQQIQLINPGVTPSTWEPLLQLSSQQPHLFPALGIHPLYTTQCDDKPLELLQQRLTMRSEVIAVGEVGLDFFPSEINKTQQQRCFEAQIEIAYHTQRPLLLHVRKAHQEVIRMLKQQPHHGGIVHAFSGSYELARQYVDCGFLIGIGGVATRSNANKLHQAIRKLPADTLALETDTPDLPPAWLQGARNTPLQLTAIAEAIAKLRREEVSSLIQQTTNNVSQRFGLPNH